MNDNMAFLGIDEHNQLIFFTNFNSIYPGACGVVMEATLTQDQVDAQNELDFVMKEYDYLWREAVANGDTTDGLEEYCEGILDEVSYTDSLFVGDDPSYRCETEEIIDGLNEELKAKVEDIIGVKDEDYVALSCSSCGYIFGDFKSVDTSNWQLVVNPDLINRIAESLRKKEVVKSDSSK